MADLLDQLAADLSSALSSPVGRPLEKPRFVGEYVYRGDRMTDPALKGVRCDAVRVLKRWGPCKAGQPPICIRGKNGNMLVVLEDGTRHVVLGRQLRKVSPPVVGS